MDTLVAALEDLKDIDHPVVLHIHTTKGLGFSDETEAQDGLTDATRPIRPHAGQREANHWLIRTARSASRLTHANTTVRWP
ncbi:MAG: hypothetical protein R2683_03595 [Bifidobacterium adolescentis]